MRPYVWKQHTRGGSYRQRNSSPKSLLGTFLPPRRKGPVVRAGGLLQPAEGPGKGIRLGACFPHRNPVASDPSAVREELEKRLIITPPSSPGHPGPGPGLWERSGEHAEAEAETRGGGAGNRPRPGPGGGVKLGVEVASGPGTSSVGPWAGMRRGGGVLGTEGQPGPLSCTTIGWAPLSTTCLPAPAADPGFPHSL